MSGLWVVTTTCMKRPAWRNTSRTEPNAPGWMVASGSSITRSEGEERWNTAASMPKTRSVPSDMLNAPKLYQFLLTKVLGKLQGQFVVVFSWLNANRTGDYAFEKLEDCLPDVGVRILYFTEDAGGVAAIGIQPQTFVWILHISQSGGFDMADLYPGQKAQNGLETAVAAYKWESKCVRLQDRIEGTYITAPCWVRPRAIEPTARSIAPSARYTVLLRLRNHILPERLARIHSVLLRCHRPAVAK